MAGSPHLDDEIGLDDVSAFAKVIAAGAPRCLSFSAPKAIEGGGDPSF